MLLVAVKFKTILISGSSNTKLNPWTYKFIYILRLLSYLSNNQSFRLLFPVKLQKLSKRRMGCEHYHLLQTQNETKRAEMLWHEHTVVVELQHNSKFLICHFPGYSLFYICEKLS